MKNRKMVPLIENSVFELTNRTAALQIIVNMCPVCENSVAVAESKLFAVQPRNVSDLCLTCTEVISCY